MARKSDSEAAAQKRAPSSEEIEGKSGTDEACQWEHVFGGQAVMEGVMMRGRRSWGVAVRRPSGDIARFSFPLTSAGERRRWLKLPVIRGVLALFESMSLGIRALGISANVGLEDPEGDKASEDGAASGADAGTEEASAADTAAETKKAEEGKQAGGAAFGWKELAVTVTVAVVFAVGLFVVIPLFVVKRYEDIFANPFLFNLVEGVIRIVIFLLYILGVSLIPDLRRVFMYHGAEHKVIHAYEACGQPDAKRAKDYRPQHPRCGTGFLLVVMVVAILVFAAVGKPSLFWLVFSRIVGIPLIIGISYEVGIKRLGRHPNSLPARVLLWPGLQLQRLTTREPTADMLEVAAAALDEVIKKDEERRLESKEVAAQA